MPPARAALLSCLLACDASAFVLLGSHARRGSARVPIAVRACEAEVQLPPPEEGDALTADDMQCSEGRIVTELVDTSCAGADKQTLPDRFLMAVRAIRGEFSPVEGVADTEVCTRARHTTPIEHSIEALTDRVATPQHGEDTITSALLNFPATVTLKVVSRPLPTSAEADQLGDELSMLLTALNDSPDEEPEIGVTERGSRRSYSLRMKVPDAAALAT
jgi:hypothetical protein